MRKRIGRTKKGVCKDKAIPLHNKQHSVNRLRVEIARKQARLEQLEKEEAALKQPATVRIALNPEVAAVARERQKELRSQAKAMAQA